MSFESYFVRPDPSGAAQGDEQQACINELVAEIGASPVMELKKDVGSGASRYLVVEMPPQLCEELKSRFSGKLKIEPNAPLQMF